MTDVFISYSRKDKLFVERLHNALKDQGRETWVDWQDIPLTADWWQEIERGIEGTATFVFILSPDSIASEVCTREINHAVKHNKRLVPIVYREGFGHTHPALARHINPAMIELAFYDAA
ncbi:toll/interleukin-1 receptor domain-containing protein [Leptolyngbya boryana CZ1]|uniref:Toll/interleukin-1 receptor domain-containing protein n=1 Tax=Leptolyngbya boryana CZ1 TaxID=3060204 RepID=A0AA96X547_LEPBY|nr:toll/interleukin-1 receptor domain-containing protein [Leptolyngbya boryana]WNZ45770.1 toll/interleukin-1 receptor domain-containing protein [Leptolyngbya boryana CZ1]